ncbi:MAG: class I SAM-dependent methyltransferase [Chitinivibrionales bacterium]
MIMKLKADWIPWLHAYRKLETDRIFQNCPDGLFHHGCELGAGDGYQSALLSRYIVSLISTEINPRLLPEEGRHGIEYRICSAEAALASFADRNFDIVFSSNLLEHVVDPQKVLSGINRVLKDDGITVNVMPGPFWKICQVLLYVPAHVLVTIERITKQHGLKNIVLEFRAVARETWRGITTGSNAALAMNYEHELQNGNNPHKKAAKPSFFESLIMPLPHGVSQSHWEEFKVFKRKYWLALFDSAGFVCISLRKGPAASGYGLGWKLMAALCEKLGLASEYIYITAKKNHVCRYQEYFV